LGINNADVSKEKLKSAQDKLVNRSLELALVGLYEHSESALCDVDTDIKIKTEEQDAQGQTVKKYTVVKLLNEQGEACQNASELLRAIIIQFPDDNPNYEFDRIGAFNYIASHNKYDLSIKSAKHKSIASIEEKIDRGKSIYEIGDLARITMISRHPNILNAFAYQAFGSDLVQDQKCENWEVNKTGVLKRVTNFQIEGIGSEVQFVPREQSQVMRISHKMYEAVRYFDVYERSKKQEETQPNEVDTKKIVDAKNELIEKYNEVAKLINILVSSKKLHPKYHEEVSRILASPDMDELTYDPESEGGLDITVTKSFHDPKYTPIIKEQGDLLTYRKYLLAMQNKVDQDPEEPIFPLPILSGQSSDEEIKAAVTQKLNVVVQLTHASGMREATATMRRQWLDGAKNLNDRVPGIIPRVIIESIAQGVPERGTAIPMEDGKAIKSGKGI